MLLKTPSLLITDDDADFRETLGDIFERRGFRTLLAQTGKRRCKSPFGNPFIC